MPHMCNLYNYLLSVTFILQKFIIWRDCWRQLHINYSQNHPFVVDTHLKKCVI